MEYARSTSEGGAIKKPPKCSNYPIQILLYQWGVGIVEVQKKTVVVVPLSALEDLIVTRS
jgi:hypothetical protein